MGARSLRRRLRLAPFAAVLLIVTSSPAHAAEHTLQTQYATIRYAQDADLRDFLWRITGSRLAPELTPEEPVKRRVDELVDRVQSLLDLYPSSLRFDIEITPDAGAGGPLAHYSHGADRRIYVSPRTVTDGILAHEIAHAVICAHFNPPPPEKAQEILARYVDQNLWGDYSS